MSTFTLALLSGAEETDYPGYARVTFRAEPSGPRALVNAETITFPECEDGEHWITGFHIPDEDAGNFVTPLRLTKGVRPNIAPGQLVMRLQPAEQQQHQQHGDDQPNAAARPVAPA